jgi:hypothetical protein
MAPVTKHFFYITFCRNFRIPWNSLESSSTCFSADTPHVHTLMSKVKVTQIMRCTYEYYEMHLWILWDAPMNIMRCTYEYYEMHLWRLNL